ncbi:hypothetical protein [Streptomyces sp. OR43]|uniref:hypothetical protein n=1 Tax=Streptomyces sp. or43 TaxID=2478957 RepID=UPI0016517993|nr:hypothetical protein [Streptomyces sp. or43]
MTPTTAESAGSAQAFRDAMAAVASPVAAASAMDGARPHGSTVGVFAARRVEELGHHRG